MKTMLLSSLVGICFIELSLLTIGVSMPYHGITGITRRRPLFVGRRYSPSYTNQKSPIRFGKQVSPIFLGRRRSNTLLGKKIAPLFLGKKAAPLYVGKKSTPMFVGKKSAPMYIGKRAGTPMFIGKKSNMDDNFVRNEMMCYDESDCPTNHCCASSLHDKTKKCIQKGRLGDVCVRANYSNSNQAFYGTGSKDYYLSTQSFCPCLEQFKCYAEKDQQVGLCVLGEGTEYANSEGNKFGKYDTVVDDLLN